MIVMNFKVQLFSLENDIPTIILCLTVAVGSISKVLVVVQKANNGVARDAIFVRCHLC